MSVLMIFDRKSYRKQINFRKKLLLDTIFLRKITRSDTYIQIKPLTIIHVKITNTELKPAHVPSDAAVRVVYKSVIKETVLDTLLLSVGALELTVFTKLKTCSEI